VLVYNKIDRIEGLPPASALRNEDGKIAELRVSAISGIGMDLLRDTIREQAENLHMAISRSARIALSGRQQTELTNAAQLQEIASLGVD
jgi:50S ribosomal subunit-associated GTPase HflX